MDRLQLLVRFGYLGDRFYGLQPQKDLATAGGALRIRLEAAAGARARGLAFAARTDAGVHALANLATCWFRPGEADLPLDEAKAAACVQQRIAVPRDDGLLRVRAEVVPRNVHARGSSAGKRYRYFVDAEVPPDAIGPETRSALGRPEGLGRFSWRIAPGLDVERMREAAALLVGEHDFSAFRGPGCSAKNPVKRLSAVRVRGPYLLPTADGREPQPPASRVVVEVVGDAFLRKMVRLLVGVLVEIGTGLRAPSFAKELLDARARPTGALLAPARGLTLVEVGCQWPPDGSGLIRELRAPSLSERDAPGA